MFMLISKNWLRLQEYRYKKLPIYWILPGVRFNAVKCQTILAAWRKFSH